MDLISLENHNHNHNNDNDDDNNNTCEVEASDDQNMPAMQDDNIVDVEVTRQERSSDGTNNKTANQKTSKIKLQLIDIFQDTLKKCNKISETTKHTFNDIISCPGSSNISVVDLDTVSAGVQYSKIGKTCILNMASYKHAGGGVVRGARAQEECLFRCSNLYISVPQSFYPLKSDECLYTKKSIFFKDRYYEEMKPVELDVVTIAAINLRTGRPSDYIDIMSNKMKLMLSLAKQNDCENIILGAWGCGVFKNNPTDVASMFKKVISQFKFKEIVFAVINDHNSVDNNFNRFKEVLC